jgi:2-keto-3-deoxy-L-rhamnonate aldolase RhmA
MERVERQSSPGAGAKPVVRLPVNEPLYFKRFLDAGTTTILIPQVNSAEEARRAACSLRYPPDGERGVAIVHRGSRYGRDPGYLNGATKRMTLIVQLESVRAVESLTDIAAVDGVSALFIGPSDLAADAGHLGSPDHPEVQ